MKELLPAFSIIVAMIALGSSAVTLTQIKAERSPSTETSRVSPDTRISVLQEELLQEKQKLADFMKYFCNLVDAGSLTGRIQSVVLDPSTKNYKRIDTENGFFLISCQDVKPFIDGYKLSLHVGNPLGVRFVGFKITVRWGPRYTGDQKDAAGYVKWFSSLKTQDFDFANALEIGQWNEVELRLLNTTASQVGYICMTLDTDKVSLKMR